MRDVLGIGEWTSSCGFGSPRRLSPVSSSRDHVFTGRGRCESCFRVIGIFLVRRELSMNAWRVASRGREVRAALLLAIAAAVRLSTPSCGSIRSTCFSTVHVLIPSIEAISELAFASAIRIVILASRGVRERATPRAGGERSYVERPPRVPLRTGRTGAGVQRRLRRRHQAHDRAVQCAVVSLECAVRRDMQKRVCAEAVRGAAERELILRVGREHAQAGGDRRRVLRQAFAMPW